MTGRDYDFWLLDFDGTVVDIEQSYVHDTVQTVGDRLGYEFTDEETELLWYGMGNAREELLGDRRDQERFWEVFHDVEEPDSRAAATYLYDDAEAFLEWTDRPIGVVTHCQAYLTEPVMAELGIGEHFEAVVCCTDETGWKPDPEPVELAMAKLGVADNGHAGAMAGDLPADVRAAHNAGLDAVHVSRHDRNWEGDRVLGDERVSSLTDLSR